ncbi:hypothetical protein ASD03_36780 [Ensifer sp. Root127]|nr:hypothetical protein ASD03_36780 [Ensifer sp. Root127]
MSHLASTLISLIARRPTLGNGGSLFQIVATSGLTFRGYILGACRKELFSFASLYMQFYV